MVAANEPPNEEPLADSPEPAPLADDLEPAEEVQTPPPAEKKSTPSVAKRSTKKKPVVAYRSKRSATHSTKAHRVAHNAKRAKPLPRLHVGSASAELVGTTSDGKWILSVADSGRRIIVPPPPGYGR